MNLRQMEYLLAIVETKNISRAAERCYISQSGMSQQLASVEKELGDPCFSELIMNWYLPEKGKFIFVMPEKFWDCMQEQKEKWKIVQIQTAAGFS